MEIWLLVIVVVIVAVIVSLAPRRKGTVASEKKNIYNYAAKTNIMTSSEAEFFKLLVDVAEDRYFVFPQVHLSAILNEKIEKQDWKSAFRHINSKSVDYVLCDKTTLQPVYAVELDDKSHDSITRQERDKEVERIFQGANLPLVRFSNYRSLSRSDIEQRFYDAHNS